MITISGYTGAWQQAIMDKKTPRVGSHVRIAESPDGREYADFERHMALEGLDWEWVRWMPRARLDVYRVVKLNRDAG